MNKHEFFLNAPLERPFKIGGFIADPCLNRVVKQDASACTIALEPRLMLLLAFLAANAGSVLSREELHNTLWPQVVVNENSLTRAISELRRQLTALDPAFKTQIETIPKRGYRLAALAQCPVAESADSTITQQLSNTQKTVFSPWGRIRNSRTGQVGATACGLLLILTLTIFPGPQTEYPSPNFDDFLADQVIEMNPAPGLDERFNISPAVSVPENLIGEDLVNSSTPVISRDGKLVAFIQFEGGLYSIMLYSLTKPETAVTLYSTTDRLFNIQWSPLEDALLFGSQALTMTTTLLEEQKQNNVKLVMLNLETLEIKILHNNSADDVISSNGTLNLT